MASVIQLNVWRPLCSKVLSSPLAIADASTISQKDLIETDQIFQIELEKYII